jgi:SAM-dependent methyltransferase
VRFGLGDAHRLPIATASFSLAWSIEAPAHFADKPAFLCELSRVVKPGGAVTFSDLAVVENVALSSPGRRRIYEAFLRAWDVPYLETWQSYHQAIAAAGFEIRRAEIVTRRNLDIWRQYCRVYMWVYRLPGLYRFCARYLENRTGADMENVHEHVIRSYEALRLGMIDYPIFWMVRR